VPPGSPAPPAPPRRSPGVPVSPVAATQDPCIPASGPARFFCRARHSAGRHGAGGSAGHRKRRGRGRPAFRRYHSELRRGVSRVFEIADLGQPQRHVSSTASWCPRSPFTEFRPSRHRRRPRSAGGRGTPGVLDTGASRCARDYRDPPSGKFILTTQLPARDRGLLGGDRHSGAGQVHPARRADRHSARHVRVGPLYERDLYTPTRAAHPDRPVPQETPGTPTVRQESPPATPRELRFPRDVSKTRRQRRIDRRCCRSCPPPALGDPKTPRCPLPAKASHRRPELAHHSVAAVP